MRTKTLGAVAALVVLLLLVLSVPVHAGPPGFAYGDWVYAPTHMADPDVAGCNSFIYMEDEGTFTGTFEGDEVEVGWLVFHCNGKASYKGNLSFSGTVADSEEGTMELRIVGTSSDLTYWEGTWVILGGEDGLAKLQGQGIWYGPPGSLTYEGNYHFEPD
jgi:hypothetical protein